MDPIDLFVIGGGINGCGIARDAAGRGLSVVLAEMNDLASATSSASTKMFHGGLRYLEYYEFRLVREALIEREVLLQAMPHISWPMRFILPHHKGMRPAWLLRLGLFLYDHLGGRKLLPATKVLDLHKDIAGSALKPGFSKAFEYSDCWVDDARLVVLNARAAQNLGAKIMTRATVTTAKRANGAWQVTVLDAGGTETVYHARALVNAGGPWVENIIRETAKIDSSEKVRLVRGSHIVVPKLFDHDKAYILQGDDGRVVFVIPYETDFTLIGTTDQDHDGAPSKAFCTDEEVSYLCDFVSEYLQEPVQPRDVVWRYSGVRPLYDDGAKSATAATRDYVLSLDEGSDGQAPLLNVFGGKITTYRRLAEAVLAKLKPHFTDAKDNWTAGVALPGGNFPVDGAPSLVDDLKNAYPFLEHVWATRLIRTFGTEAKTMLGDAKTIGDVGMFFGTNLSAQEVRWMMDHEFAQTAEDVIWRRTKLGLQMSDTEVEVLRIWMQKQSAVDLHNAAAQ